jgi:predicted kinase
MSKLIITRGLPGSGKSTFARGWVAEDPVGRAEVNRDYLRRMLHDGTHIHGFNGTEASVTAVLDAAIKSLLRKGIDVVCSDTNLPQRVARDLSNIAMIVGAEFEVQDFTDVPLDLCLERDALRDPSVGAEVIRGMHSRYLAGKTYPLPLPEPAKREEPKVLPYVPKPGARKAIIVDIDGTVAVKGDRSPYDWHRVREDTPNEATISAVSMAWAAGHAVLFTSGRDEVCREDTEAWLGEQVLQVRGDYDTHLFMRPAGDTRKDSVVKLELFDQHIRDHYDVRFVLDDRDQVVRMWRSLGLTCFQVAEGSF